MDYLLGVLIVLLLITVVQRSKRYSNVHHVCGVDMRGVDEIQGMKAKVRWIRSQPNYNPHHCAYYMLDAWDRRVEQLDKVKS